MAGLSEFTPENDESVKSGAQLKKEYRKREIKGWIITIAVAVIIVLLLRLFVLEIILVDGGSMEPAIYSNEYVFMEKVSYWFDAPQRGDIVVCLFPGSEDYYISRVVGLPGESIKVDGGVLYINGAPNCDYFTGKHSEDMQECTVPENCVVVMGDDRNNSKDSREVGPVPYDNIKGKVIFIVWPLDKIRGL